MTGVALIEGKELNWIREQLILIQQQNLAIIKQLKELSPQAVHSAVPDFISIREACDKYHISHVTVNNKLKLFKKVKDRPIDRIRSGSHYLINEAELQEALRMKSDSFLTFPLNRSAR